MKNKKFPTICNSGQWPKIVRKLEEIKPENYNYDIN